MKAKVTDQITPNNVTGELRVTLHFTSVEALLQRRLLLAHLCLDDCFGERLKKLS